MPKFTDAIIGIAIVIVAAWLFAGCVRQKCRVYSIGGCDAKGFCGVSYAYPTEPYFYTGRMQYPILGQIVEERFCR